MEGLGLEFLPKARFSVTSRKASVVMSPTSHVFHEIFLHINWHCHEDSPLIVPAMEPHLYELIRTYCNKYPGIFYQGSDGTQTHVHLAIQMAPTVCPSDFIGKVKGYASHELNRLHPPNKLKWQRGYGVVSFAKQNLPAVLRYIRDQKEHHKANRTRATLERWYLDPPEGEYTPGQEY